MLYAILILAVLTAVTFVSYDGVVSPALVVRKTFNLLGFAVGAVPETAKTTVAVVKATNLAAVEELAATGVEAPKGFKDGLAEGKTASREFFTEVNAWAEELEADTKAKETARKAEEA